MAKTEELRIRLSVEEDGSVRAAFGNAERQLASLGSTARGIGGSFEAVRRSIFSVQGAIVGLGAGAAIRAVVTNTMEAEKSFALLSQRVTQTGGAAGFTADQLAEIATGFQRVTTFSDEAVQGVQTKLLRFRGVAGDTFTRTTALALDMATAMGTDAGSAAELLGRALQNPENATKRLTRAKIDLTDAEKEGIKAATEAGDRLRAQEIILEAVETRFGGAARAARDNFSGALEGLKNVAGDLLEAKSGLPGLTAELNRLTDYLAKPETKAAADQLLSGLLARAQQLIATLPKVAENLPAVGAAGGAVVGAKIGGALGGPVGAGIGAAGGAAVGFGMAKATEDPIAKQRGNLVALRQAMNAAQDALAALNKQYAGNTKEIEANHPGALKRIQLLQQEIDRIHEANQATAKKNESAKAEAAATDEKNAALERIKTSVTKGLAEIDEKERLLGRGYDAAAEKTKLYTKAVQDLKKNGIDEATIAELGFKDAIAAAQRESDQSVAKRKAGEQQLNDFLKDADRQLRVTRAQNRAAETGDERDAATARKLVFDGETQARLEAMRRQMEQAGLSEDEITAAANHYSMVRRQLWREEAEERARLEREKAAAAAKAEADATKARQDAWFGELGVSGITGEAQSFGEFTAMVKDVVRQAHDAARSGSLDALETIGANIQDYLNKWESSWRFQLLGGGGANMGGVTGAANSGYANPEANRALGSLNQLRNLMNEIYGIMGGGIGAQARTGFGGGLTDLRSLMQSNGEEQRRISREFGSGGTMGSVAKHTAASADAAARTNVLLSSINARLSQSDRLGSGA